MDLKLESEPENCERCGLFRYALSPFIAGDGEVGAPILIIGEAPGQTEDEQGVPFVGKAGKLLRRLEEEAGVADIVAHTNVLQCRPVANQAYFEMYHRTNRTGYNELKVEIACCKPRLVKEVRRRKPKVIVCVGNTASRVVCRRIERGIVQLCRLAPDLAAIPVICAYHPSYALMNEHAVEQIRETLKLAKRVYTGDYIDPNSLIVHEKPPDDISIVAFDLETEGLSWWKEGVDIICCAFCWEPGHVSIHSPYDPVVRKVLTDDRITKVGQNIRFDCTWAESHGIEVRGELHDTMLQHHLLHPNPPHSLEMLSQTYIGKGQYGHKTKLMWKQGKEVPPDDLENKCMNDADATLRLHYLFLPQIKKSRRLWPLYRDIVMPLSRVLTDMELRGVNIDKKRWAEIEKSVENRIGMIREKIRKEWKINPNSNYQKIDLLYNRLKLPVLKKTKQGAPSVDKQTLKMLAGHTDHPIIKILLEYAKLEKMYTVYLKGYKKFIAPDGRIHCNYVQEGTRTGRLASSDPNLQNVPHEVKEYDIPSMREVFVPSDGNIFLGFDWSQLELRVAAALSKDETMIEHLSEGDIHAAFGARIFGCKPENVDKQKRIVAKRIVFGVLYGITPFGVREQLQKEGILVSEAQAEDWIDLFYSTYPGVEKLQKRIWEYVKRNKRVVTPFGRFRPIEGMSGGKHQRAKAYKKAVNTPIQSAAAEITYLAMIKLWKVEAPMVLQIHDEVILDTPTPDKYDIPSIVQDNYLGMPKEFWKVDVSTGSNWAEIK